MRSLCVEVPLAQGEAVRRRLQEEGRLRKNLRIGRAGDRLLIPVTDAAGLSFPVREREFDTGFSAVRSYRDLVDVPADLEPLLPRAFDSIGDIVVLRMPEELRAHERAIGEAILRWSPKLRTVAVDEGVHGELRIRKVRVVAGEPKTRTVHVEFGLRYLVDVERAYFSPRLGTERLRIARQVRPGETVVDMFAGVGPYAILIARTARPALVHAVDANPAAVELLRENVGRNRAEKVVVHEGPGQETLPHIAPVDRVIMDLPHGGSEFLADAITSVRAGGAVHYYAIVERAVLEDAKEEAAARASKGGRHVEVRETRVVRPYAPGKAHVAFDLVIT